jgi:hypothetical protein
MGEYEIRAFRRGDESSLLATYNTVFAASRDGVRARTPEEWSWAFEQNPAGQRIFVAEHEGEIVAQYAALPERIWIGGEERVFAQIVDSMVHPAHRAGLKRPGLFVRTAEAFFEHFGGPDRDLVHFGWPIEEALRIGERFLRYEIVRTQLALAREVRGKAGAAVELPRGVEPIARFDHQARWLWDRCAGDFGACAIRDERFLNWRFVEHPRERYTALGARDADGILRGVAVIKVGRWILPNLCVIADWLVPPAERDVGDALLAAIDVRASEQGAQAVVTILPEWSPWFAHFQEQGFLAHPTDYALVARNFHRRYSMAWLREHWWVQLADSDLV